MLSLISLAIDAAYRAWRRRQCRERGRHRWDGLTCTDCGTSLEGDIDREDPVSGFSD